MPLGRTHVLDQGTEDERTVYECSYCGYYHPTAEGATDCHSYFCEECGTEHNYEEDAESCCRPEVYTCDYCQEEYSTWEEAENCCQHSCQHCGNRYPTQEAADDCHRTEVEEARRVDRRRRLRHRYPPEIINTPVSHTIRIPPLTNRPGRLCSIEQELSDGGHRAARLLYDMGFCTTPDVSNYTDQGQPGWITVKQDGSLDRTFGGEVVYSRFDLTRPNGYGNLSRAMACLRELRNQGLVRTDRSAGTHIHISAIDRTGGNIFGPAQMASLYEIFSFSEDVLFRLAAAGWQQHRGDRYTRVLPKFGSEVTAGKVARNALREGGRYYSLNFMRLLDAARNCRCGACPVGDWQECSCGTLASGTIEWRIFNATTKPETLHGWLILAHAITAKAFDFTLGSLPEPNGYGDSPQERHPWIFAWILNECPMQDSERQILIDLAKRSPDLQIDWEDFDRSGYPGFTLSDEETDEDDVPEANLDEIFAGLNS